MVFSESLQVHFTMWYSFKRPRF